MIVTCPSCGAKYRLSDDKIQGRGARITCPTCTHKFVVYRNEEQPAPLASALGPANPSVPVGSVASNRGVPVTIAKQGQVVKNQMTTDPEEEAPTTLMPHGSGLSGGRLGAGALDDEDSAASSPVAARSARAPSGPQAAPSANSRFATYLVMTVVGTAVLVFLLSNGVL